MANDQPQPTPTNAEERFAFRLRAEREKRGWSQAEVARRLKDHGIDLHFTAIAKMEQRDVERPRMIRLDEAAALAEVFGLPFEEMIATPANEFEHLVMRFTTWAESLKRTDELGLLALLHLRKLVKGFPGLRDATRSETVEQFRSEIMRTLAKIAHDSRSDVTAWMVLRELEEAYMGDAMPPTGRQGIELGIMRIIWSDILDVVETEYGARFAAEARTLKPISIQGNYLYLVPADRHDLSGSDIMNVGPALGHAIDMAVGIKLEVHVLPASRESLVDSEEPDPELLDFPHLPLADQESVVNGYWSRIMKVVKAKDRDAWVRLSEKVDTVKVGDEELTVKFAFPSDRSEFLENREDVILEQAIEELLGVDWTVYAEVEDPPF